MAEGAHLRTVLSINGEDAGSNVDDPMEPLLGTSDGLDDEDYPSMEGKGKGSRLGDEDDDGDLDREEGDVEEGPHLTTKNAIKILKDLTVAPGRVEDVLIYKERKLQKKPPVVYLKTVRLQ